MSRSVTPLSGDDGARFPQDRAFEPFRKFLFFVARKQLCGSILGPDAASDFVQETFLAAIKADQDGHGAGPTEGDQRRWLRRILINKIREAVRREAAGIRGGGAQPVPLPEDPPGSGTSPSERFDRKSRGELLRQAMDLLPPLDRKLLTWSLCEGRSRKEIGDLIGVSASYASRLCDRAEHALRDAYLALGGTEDFR